MKDKKARMAILALIDCCKEELNLSDDDERELKDYLR